MLRIGLLIDTSNSIRDRFGFEQRAASDFLRFLFEWQRAARQNNSRISFRNLPQSLQSLAALYGVTDLVAADA